ncbi:endonuclease/exonuclease/phosphatase family protein [Methylocucumis oryzae]|uniref:Endonuclease/exonuclease/phosphatase domain-containing protein n=1 Tax=Methylocucumis oryzae TaxID=1632867 RepID=A0A0F3ILI7_9GAMM|nr:endonuclease/exonuclease/phosphatase family protein [Methylocucumis oryzae]KJV07600.1 hypothetical protein VZ94_03740 [Methylocucumis oryzae]
MSRWLKSFSITLFSIVAFATFISVNGVQYVFAYLGNEFANPLPDLSEFQITPERHFDECTSQPITVMTYNVEYGSQFIEDMAATFRHGDTGGALPWSTRAPEIRERIASYAPHLIGLQETHTNEDIHNIVSPNDYTLVSYHRGTFQYGDAALLFRKDKFNLLTSGQLWLGPQPDLPMSFGFKRLAMVRYANWALLKEKNSHFQFYLLIRTFDNASANKEPSADLFRERISALARGIPIIVTGDFNSTATTERYQKILGNEPQLLFNAFSLSHAVATMPELHPDQRIDHILAGGPCQISSDLWFIDTRPLANGQRMSDHDAIIARLQFKP